MNIRSARLFPLMLALVLVTENCDFTVSIPMFGKINSLNASAAAAVLLYEAVRQRVGG